MMKRKREYEDVGFPNKGVLSQKTSDTKMRLGIVMQTAIGWM